MNVVPEPGDCPLPTDDERVDEAGPEPQRIPRQSRGVSCGSRSKRLGWGPLTSGLGSHLKGGELYTRLSWSTRLSSISCSRMYRRITSSSRPTVETK